MFLWELRRRELQAFLSIRIGLDSSIGGVAQELHEKWPELGLKYYNMCFNRDEKDNLIESDGELHSLACYCFAKKIAIVKIRVVVCVTSLITSSGSISASSSSSSSSSVSGGGGVVVVRKPFKSDFWARNFDGGVGQQFALGAPEFRCKLIEYSIVSGYKYELIKNDEFKVTAVCVNKKEENCEWCIHSCDIYESFEIKKINLTNTCGFAFKDYNHPPLTFYLVMTHILDFAIDKPSLSLGDITSFYSREYGLKISKHMSYAGKKLALTELYGDVALSYNELLWYTKELKRRDPGNCVDLQAFGYERRYTFLSDRHHGLLVNIPFVFPYSYHSFCLWHMENNLRTALSKTCGVSKYLVGLFKKCAYASTHKEFQEHVAELLNIGGDAVSNFLSRAPYDN
ncbi:hypothetical protein IFM89_019333 [Coptis chinensis]|uniref:Transposase MuDR plant domain-containing protein n=1 Tax=Coptis chinensis TaxID=261450 RepID=A0A835I1G6_9MAGN|nr:hypothetical protein IFM89_019333 [Coptis chinensis]